MLLWGVDILLDRGQISLLLGWLLRLARLLLPIANEIVLVNILLLLVLLLGGAVVLLVL